jgi:starch phosphorylase
VGTWDGANVEMADFIGAENMYLFGAKAAEIEKMKEAEISSIPFTLIKNDSEIEKLIQGLISGEFATSEKEKEVLKNIANLLLARDEYFVLYDLKAFDEQIQLASKTYLDQNQWTTKMLLNIARMYYFSSDRSIDEYNKNDWKLRSLENIR